MRIGIIYKSKAEERRMRKLKLKIARLGLSGLDIYLRLQLGVASIMALIFACGIDSQDFEYMFKGLVICFLTALLSGIAISALKEI